MTKLDELLDDARALEAGAKEERQADLAARCEAARAAIVAAFDGLWDEFAPYADGGHYRTDNGRDDGDMTDWWLVITAPGLAPFSAVLSNRRDSAPYLTAHTVPEYGWAKYPFRDLPQFLLDCRRAWEEEEAGRVEKEIKAARAVLDDWYSPRGKCAPAEAGAAEARLCALAPERENEWVALRLAWQRDHEGYLAERAAEAEAKTRAAALADEYESAYRLYRAESRRARDTNKARMDALQAELDRPIRVYRLTFALSTTNDDGEVALDTDQVFVLSDQPDAEGYYIALFRHGAQRRMRYRNVVSFEGPLDLLPSEGLVCNEVTLGSQEPWFRYTLRFAPALDGAEISRQAQELLEPWPAAPAVPDGLYSGDAAAIRRRVQPVD